MLKDLQKDVILKIAKYTRLKKKF